jgi:hypothetical protein
MFLVHDLITDFLLKPRHLGPMLSDHGWLYGGWLYSSWFYRGWLLVAGSMVDGSIVAGSMLSDSMVAGSWWLALADPSLQGRDSGS